MKMLARLVLILMGLGVLMLISNAEYAVIALKPAVDFNTLSASQFQPGMHLEGEVGVLLDTFAEEESWRETKGGDAYGRHTSNLYYIMPVGEEEYIGLEVPSRHFETADQINNETLDYLTGLSDSLGDTLLPIAGTVVEMQPELLEYFQDWFVETEFLGTTSQSQLDPYQLPYVIRLCSFTGSCIQTVIGAALVLGGAAYFVIQFRQRKASAVHPGQPDGQVTIPSRAEEQNAGTFPDGQ